jgi:hypothetical protein
VIAGPTKLPQVFLCRCLGSVALSVTLGVLAAAAAPAASFADVQAPAGRTCAGATTTTRGPAGTAQETKIQAGESAPQSGCWEDVQPYPFGSGGGPVEPSTSLDCQSEASGETCYLDVISMAFRAWNRGLALTTVVSGSKDPYGVWRFNGTRWYPETTFPGSEACPGQKIVWASKLDFWIVGAKKLCRFDGYKLEWEQLALPAATEERLTEPLPKQEDPGFRAKSGAITSASCLAWNNCWFFGGYGAVVHWNGQALTDESPDPSQSLLQGEYTAATARESPVGEQFGVAVGATSAQLGERTEAGLKLGPLSTEEQMPPVQLYSSSGGTFSPLPFSPFTKPLVGDPFRTDLVAVDLDSEAQGWVAGNPAGLRTTTSALGAPSQPEQRRAQPESQPQYSPLEPVSTSGAAAACEGPPEDRFAYTPFPGTTPSPGTTELPPEEPGAFLWQSIGVLPTLGEAVAGGKFWPATNTRENNQGEPVIAQAACDGTTRVTRFRVPDSASPGAFAPADPNATVTAISADAPNDAWAATSNGETPPEPPHLYRLTNGKAPEAPEGNDQEERPSELQIEPPVFVIEPQAPEEQAPAPATVTRTKAVKLPPAIYDVKAKLHTSKRHGKVNLSLYVTFQLRRSVTIGAKALRKGRVVSEARPRHFVGHSGTLILRLNRQHWPTTVSFIT